MVFFNDDYSNYAHDLTLGLLKAFPDEYEKLCFDGGSSAILAAKNRRPLDKTAVVVFGGGGNGPMLHGTVAKGMADASVLGLAYASANGYAIYGAGKLLGGQSGVFYLYNQFMGDSINYKIAHKLLSEAGIDHACFAVADDIATAQGEPKCKRNGRLALAYLTRIASNCANLGLKPAQIKEKVEKAAARIGTISCKIDTASGIVEYGNGFSGEPGIVKEEYKSPSVTAQKAVTMIVDDLKPQTGEKIFAMLNRLRLVSCSDSYIMHGAFLDALEKAGLKTERGTLANYSNILDVYGFDFCIFCADEEMQGLIGPRIQTPFFTV